MPLVLWLSWSVVRKVSSSSFWSVGTTVVHFRSITQCEAIAVRCNQLIWPALMSSCSQGTSKPAWLLTGERMRWASSEQKAYRKIDRKQINIDWWAIEIDVHIATQRRYLCQSWSIDTAPKHLFLDWLLLDFQVLVMTDDASTAYICIYCPFNSSNLEALENHLISMNWLWCHLDLIHIDVWLCLNESLGAHGHGCQDAQSTIPQSFSLSPSNISNKASKREAPDDEQVRIIIWSRWFFSGEEHYLTCLVSIFDGWWEINHR